MKPNPKQTRETDPEYLKYIRHNCCLILCQKAEPHHVKSVGSGGSDYLTVPLSRELHSECHQIGQATFQEKYLISFDKAIERLLGEYIENKFSISVIDILISYIKAKKLSYLDSLPF